MASGQPLIAAKKKSKASFFYNADDYMDELKKKFESDPELLELMGAAPDSGGGGQGHIDIDEGGRSKKTGRKLPVSNRPDPMPADLEFLFTKITPEQSMYMWRFLSCVFLFQCILVFVYAGLLHLGNFWAVTIPWGIVVWYTAIQHIYVDHDVMHGATFPPYWWQKFLTHPFSEPLLSLPWEEFIFEHMKHHTSTIDLLTQGEFGWDPETPLYWLMENKFNFITGPIGVPLAHFIGLNDTGMTFALEWFMHMPEAGAGGKCNKDFWSKWFPRRLKHCAFIWGVWSCVWLVGELMSPVGGWTFFLTTAICNRCGYGTAWAFITNFTHSHPWQNFLTGIGGVGQASEAEGRASHVWLNRIMSYVLGGPHRWNEMLYHDVHHAFPNAIGTMSQRGRFHPYNKVADACVEVLHRGLFVPSGDKPTQMEENQKRRTDLLMKSGGK